MCRQYESLFFTGRQFSSSKPLTKISTATNDKKYFRVFSLFSVVVHMAFTRGRFSSYGTNRCQPHVRKHRFVYFLMPHLRPIKQRHSANVGLMLVQQRRWWPNMKLTLAVFAGGAPKARNGWQSVGCRNVGLPRQLPVLILPRLYHIFRGNDLWKWNRCDSFQNFGRSTCGSQQL